MDSQKDKSSTPIEQSSSSRADYPTRKPAGDWEQPDFEELDLCLEVTAYVYHWQ